MKNLKIFLIAIIVVLVGVAIWFAYTADYKYTSDIASLQQAIENKANDGARVNSRVMSEGLNVEILEVAETEQGLVAFVRHRVIEQSFGFVFFERGPNRRYRFQTHRMERFVPYSSFVTVRNEFVDFGEYRALVFHDEVIIAGFNVGDVSEFGIKITRDVDNFIELEDGTWQRLFIGEVILPIESEQFIKVLKRDYVLELAELTDEDLLRTAERIQEFRRPAVADIYEVARLYNDAGIDITETFAIEVSHPIRQGVGGGSLFATTPYSGRVFFILIVGAILIRLVIKPPVRSRPLQKQQGILT